MSNEMTNGTWKRACHVVVWLIIVVLVCGYVVEWYLFRKGYRVENLDSLRYYHSFDQYLGWTLTPNEDRNMGVINGVEVHERIGADAARISRPQLSKKASKKVLVLGCSHAYGWQVPDKETFCWKLNESYPDICFDNFAVPAYGTYQCYLTEKRLLMNHSDYDLVLYCCFDDHVLRNTAWAAQGNSIKQPGKPFIFAPRADLDWRGQLRFYEPVRRWPGDDFLVSINFAKRIYYCMWVDYCKNHVARDRGIVIWDNASDWAVFWALVEKMAVEAEHRGSRFGVVWLFDSGTWAQACRKRQELAANYPWWGQCPWKVEWNYPCLCTGFSDVDNPALLVSTTNRHYNGTVHSFWASEIGPWVKELLYSKKERG